MNIVITGRGGGKTTKLLLKCQEHIIRTGLPVYFVCGNPYALEFTQKQAASVLKSDVIDYIKFMTPQKFIDSQIKETDYVAFDNLDWWIQDFFKHRDGYMVASVNFEPIHCDINVNSLEALEPMCSNCDNFAWIKQEKDI